MPNKINIFAQNHTCVIMSNSKDFINRTSEYIRFMSNEDVCLVPIDKDLFGVIPMSITQCYTLYKGMLFEKEIIFAFASDNNQHTPVQMKKELTLLENKTRCLSVLVIEKAMSYNVKRFIDQRINFIIPQKQMFIPSLLIDLKKTKTINTDIKETMPGLAQCMLLYHIQVGSIDGMKSEDIQALFDVSYATVNRALRWLKKNGLIMLEGKKTKEIRFFYSNKELWDTALPLFNSPVEKVVYTDDTIEPAIESGINALSEYTMINSEKSHCYALTREDLKTKDITINNYLGENKIEIWRYSPFFLTEGHYVDKLSLYLSLINNNDERIQIELENLINDIKW